MQTLPLKVRLAISRSAKDPNSLDRVNCEGNLAEDKKWIRNVNSRDIVVID